MISMDWMPTLLAAVGTHADPAYPAEGISLLSVLTRQGSGGSEELYWRYRANAQRAMRDRDMKWLKIRENTFSV
jgi:hypothetical protein